VVEISRFLLLICLAIGLNAGAQVDTNYIQRFPSKLVVSPFISSQSATIAIRPYNWVGDTNITPFDYQPNLRGGYGISFSYRIIDFSLGFRQKISANSEKIYGKSSSFGLSFRVWASRKILAECNLQSVSGFANISTQQFDTINYTKENPYQLRPDLTMQFIKLRMVYQSNPDKFSYRSSFGFSERQKKSAAGFLFNTRAYLHSFFADSSLIPSQLKNNYPHHKDINQMAMAAIGVAPGIGGTWTRGRWFLTGVLFVGVDLQNLRYEEAGGTEFKQETKLSANADFRVSLGYNTPRFFFGIQSINDYTLLRPSPFKMNTNYNKGLFSIGYRFDSPKTLDKTYDAAVNLIIPEKHRKFMY